jgi:HlyD family secretion protein
VKPNGHVEKDQVLLRLEDTEARARLAAAVAEAEASRRERDAHPVTAGRETVNKAEDAVFDAERIRASARLKLDEAIAASRAPGEAAQTLAASRQEFADATDRLAKARADLAATQAKGDAPAPSRPEVEVIAAGAKVAAGQRLFDETRIRAPAAATVLQINARAGELVAREADTPLTVMGDTSLMRVRAEVDERDVARIKVGQEAVIRNEAYPGVDFHGRVTEIAPVLGVPHLSSRNVHRLPDVDVVQVLIDLNGTVTLLPGMQTDVFFEPYPEQEAPKAPDA